MKVGEKTNSGDLPLIVWCILALALTVLFWANFIPEKKAQKKAKQNKTNKKT